LFFEILQSNTSSTLVPKVNHLHRCMLALFIHHASL